MLEFQNYIYRLVRGGIRHAKEHSLCPQIALQSTPRSKNSDPARGGDTGCIASEWINRLASLIV